MIRLFYFTLSLVTFIILFDVAQARTFKIGYISGSQKPSLYDTYNRLGYQISGAIKLAVDSINEAHPDQLLLNETLEFEYAETYGSEDLSIKHTARFCVNNYSVIIGPQETCIEEAKLAAKFNTLMLTYFCKHIVKDAQNSARFSTFVSVKPPVAQIVKPLALLLLRHTWMKVALVHHADRDEIAAAVVEGLKTYQIRVNHQETWRGDFFVSPDHFVTTTPSFESIVQRIKNKARNEHIGIMEAVRKANLLAAGEYFVVGIYLEPYKSRATKVYLTGKFVERQDKATVKDFHHFLGIVPAEQTIKFPEFDQKVNENMRKPPFNFEAATKSIIIRPEAAYLHDAVMLYAGALNKCLSDPVKCPDPHNGTHLMENFLDRSYTSVLGYNGYIDQYGNALGNYTLLAVGQSADDPESWDLVDIGTFTPIRNSTNASLEFKDGRPPEVPFSLHNFPPRDEPECGYEGKKCPVSWVTIVAGIGTSAVILLLILLVYRNQAFRQELDRLLWKIEWKDLHVEQLQAYLASYFQCGPEDGDATSIVESMVGQFTQIDEMDLKQIYTKCNIELGVYKNQLVAIKRFKQKKLELNKEMKTRLKKMSEITHENWRVFFGACVSPLSIVMEYCQRGSLSDIIADNNFRLDHMFTASLVSGIVKGMRFLHVSDFRSHGNLKPTNILLDSNFTVKISDFALKYFKRPQPANSVSPELLLWTAPELLRLVVIPIDGTSSADVFSFGIVFYQLFARCRPYESLKMSSEEIISSIREDKKGLFRPPLWTLNDPPEYVVDLMQSCWDENPAKRPTFPMISEGIKPLQRNMKHSFVDNMLSLVQRHANNLENLVGERTLELEEEKRRTETLLYEMLPRPVAEHLIKGENVEPEQFESVTIFFSDIVGFTSLSASSSPLEVVNFLNDLYTLFDQVLHHYKYAYKVETIGDSYMVCSGLPERNGPNHAEVIGDMALELLDSIKHFRIRHKPAQSLLLRIGVHSGPCVAGVVGLKMPRYCLFGDTVNTASRYESTGKPLMIHCSQQFKNLLDENQYTLKPRGLVSMKGKGEQLTFWLLDGPDRRAHLERLENGSMTELVNTDRNFLFQKEQELASKWRRVSLAGSSSGVPQNTCFRKRGYGNHLHPSQDFRVQSAEGSLLELDCNTLSPLMKPSPKLSPPPRYHVIAP